MRFVASRLAQRRPNHGAVAVKVWYRAQPGLVERIREEVSASYPDFTFVDNGDAPLFRGTYQVRESNTVYAEFDIEIGLPEDSPKGPPFVREIGGKIPHEADRYHVNKEDGTLCVVLPDEYWYRYPGGLTLVEFMNQPLRAHLAGQALVARGEPWPTGEWSHGQDGALEFYARVLSITDVTIVARFIEVLAKDNVKGHWDCPCGSGKRLRKCHASLIYELHNRIPPAVPRRFLKKP
jgi:hypothetical protein